MKKKLTLKKILLSLLAVILIALTVFAVAFFRYYPHYQKEKMPITVSPAG